MWFVLYYLLHSAALRDQWLEKVSNVPNLKYMSVGFLSKILPYYLSPNVTNITLGYS